MACRHLRSLRLHILSEELRAGERQRMTSVSRGTEGPDFQAQVMMELQSG